MGTALATRLTKWSNRRSTCPLPCPFRSSLLRICLRLKCLVPERVLRFPSFIPPVEQSPLESSLPKAFLTKPSLSKALGDPIQFELQFPLGLRLLPGRFLAFTASVTVILTSLHSKISSSSGL